MTLQRKKIREAAAAAIVAASTDLGSRVHENRVLPFQHRELPACSIYTQGEVVDELTRAPLEYARACELVVQVVVDGNRDVDDEADALCQQVENAIHNSANLSGQADFVRLTRVVGPELAEEGRAVVAGVNLVFEALYSAEAVTTEAPADDFATAHAEHETHAPRAGAEATDDVELEVVP